MNKAVPSTSGISSSKFRKNSKDREKRKSQPDTNNHNSNDKTSPSKDSGSSRSYAGIGYDSICTYAEQTTFEHLSEEVCDVLTEDTNYRLRYIIQDALMKARLSGHNFISSNDVEESFANLKLEKVYGAPANPNWVPLGDQNLYYLDDTKINLIELAQKQSTYVQPGDPIITRRWSPEQKEVSPTLKNYFSSMCLAIVDKDAELREFALEDISQNPQAGPIIEWFYRFGYFLLSKDISYDCLTLYALDLIETLENSILGRQGVTEKQLKLLVRLLLQRLLKSVTTTEVLKQMCMVLALLCERMPLRELVFTKIQQKMPQICLDCALPVVTIINSLGLDAIQQIFIPNMNYFLTRIKETKEAELSYAIMGSYHIICNHSIDDVEIHNSFREAFGDFLVMFWHQKIPKLEASEKAEINVVNVRKALIRTRRKIPVCKKIKKSFLIEDVFEMEPPNDRLRFKLESHMRNYLTMELKTSTHVTVGKTSLLLPELRNRTQKVKCHDHTLLSYNL